MLPGTESPALTGLPEWGEGAGEDVWAPGAGPREVVERVGVSPPEPWACPGQSPADEAAEPGNGEASRPRAPCRGGDCSSGSLQSEDSGEVAGPSSNPQVWESRAHAGCPYSRPRGGRGWATVGRRPTPQRTAAAEINGTARQARPNMSSGGKPPLRKTALYSQTAAGEGRRGRRALRPGGNTSV